MKKLNKGFTLAEVLIALTVIGIISAITLPTTLSNYQSKLVGVKLSKFVNQIETVSLPYIADNNILNSQTLISDFINKSFVFKDVLNSNGDSTESLNYAVSTQASNAQTAVLKDGTSFKVLLTDNLKYTKHSAKIDTQKVGIPTFEIIFNPAIKGLSSSVQQTFNFTVTEKGYVYPKDNDDCLWAIYNNDYVTTSSLINSSCSSDTEKNNNYLDNNNIQKEIDNNYDMKKNEIGKYTELSK